MRKPEVLQYVLCENGKGAGEEMRSWDITQIPEKDRRQFIVECLTEYIEEAEELELLDREPDVAGTVSLYAEIIRLLGEK